MALLQNAKNLSKSFGARPLFRGISISFDDSERTGLIGPNGAGKSTLLKILAGLEHADDGDIEARRNLRLGYLAQQDTFGDGQTVDDVLTAAMADQPGDAHDHEVEAAILLSKIGFTDTAQIADTLSGGWKKRLAVARQLIRKPDLLLLDEPTNHLDLDGILWLEKLLLSSQMAFVVISHDRTFLEKVTNRTVEFSPAYADGYLSINGPYSLFLEKRADFLEAQASRQGSLASTVRGEIEWLRRGPKARGTKAKGRIQQAGEMMKDLADLKTRNAVGGTTTQVDFAATQRQTRKLINVTGVSKSLGGRTLFRDVDFVLAPGTKLGLLGPNGSGKSTIIRLLNGGLEPDSGTIKRADALKVVVFDQARAALDPKQTLGQALSPTGDTVYFQGRSQHITGWAQRFLFRTEQLDLPVGQLSGGEQARVMIARMMLEPADVLILDEPTNDLDIPSLGVLEASLETFPGALVLVTHDRYMLDRLASDILGLDGRGNANLVADLEQYMAWRQTTGQAVAKTQAKTVAGLSTGTAPVKPVAKKLSWMEQRELEQMEAKIHTAEADLATLQEKAAGTTGWQQSRDTYAAVEAAQKKVADLYARWEKLEAKK